MAFAATTNKPMRNLNKVSGGALEEWQKTAKEDGSVSNSSSTTTGRGSSVYDESEANKARNDGSGSSNDSGSTVKAYKESTQDESCSSGSRSEQAQCEDSEQPKQQNSLKTAGPMESIGSVGHPDNCKPCAFYCFSLCGCRMDQDCAYCHLFHQSRLKQRREDWKRAQRLRRSKQRPKTSNEATVNSSAAVLTPGAIGAGTPAPGLAPPPLTNAQVLQVPYPVPEMPTDASTTPLPAGLLAPLRSGEVVPSVPSVPEMPGPRGPLMGASSATAEDSASQGEDTLEGLIQQVSMNTALLRSLLPVLSGVSNANRIASLLAGHQAEVLNAHGAYATNGLPVNNLHPPHALQDNLTDFLHQGVMELFEYVPNSLEVFVGQMLELWPPISQMRGCLFAVTAKGVLLPESRKTLLRRRRETRQAALGDSEAAGALAIPVIPSKRRRGSRDGPVLLDEIESDLFYGAHQGSVSACAGAVAQGADVNVRNKADLDGIGIGATALHVAAVRGHEDVAAALLHAKADCMALTGRGESPVQLATRMGHVEVVKVLRTAGAAPKHEEGVVQLMSQAPSAWRDGQRKKLRKAITGDGANGARPKEALPPPPPPPGVWEGPDERMAKGPEESPKVKGKGKAKGKRRRKGKEGKPDY